MYGLLKRTVFRNFSTYLLKNARVVNPDMSFASDVLLEEGKISAVAPNLYHKNATVVDCTDKMVIPGGIDTHVHMQFRFMGATVQDDFNTGTKAALAGGTTTIIDFAVPSKGETLTDAYNKWRGWADPQVNCDYALHAVLTDWNDNESPAQMKKMVEAGISSFKFFLAYKGALKF
jgi:dihydropyrimidinase